MNKLFYIILFSVSIYCYAAPIKHCNNIYIGDKVQVKHLVKILNNNTITYKHFNGWINGTVYNILNNGTFVLKQTNGLIIKPALSTGIQYHHLRLINT